MDGHNGCPKKGGGRILPKGWKREFFKALGECGVVTYSAKRAGVSVTTIQRYRKSDPKFLERFDDALESAVEAMELEARRRAVDGTAKPVYQGGKLVGHIQEYSDVLLIFLLKANRPEKYRESASVIGSVNMRLPAANQSYAKVMEAIYGPNAPAAFKIPAVDDRPDPEGDALRDLLGLSRPESTESNGG